MRQTVICPPAEIILDASGHVEGNSITAHRRNERAWNEGRIFADTLVKVGERERVSIEIPKETGDFPKYIHELCEQLTEDKFGRIWELPNGNIRMNCFKTEKKRGLLSNTFTRTMHTHELFGRTFKMQRMPYTGWMPKDVVSIQDNICKSPMLRNAARMATGFLVAVGEDVVDVTREDNAVAKAGKAAWSKTVAGARAAVAGARTAAAGVAAGAAAVAAGVSAAASSVASAGGAMVATAAVDPGLIIGDVVLTLFKEEE